MPTIAEIEFLPDVDGRILLFTYHTPLDAALDYARLLRPGESVLGVPFEEIVAAGSGRIVPDGQVGWQIEAWGTDGSCASSSANGWRSRGWRR